MKIRTTHTLFRTAHRMIAVFSAVLIGATVTASIAEAQSSAPVQGGVLNHGDEVFRVVSTAAYRTAADAGERQSGTVQQVGSVDPLGIMPPQLASCTTCGPAGGGYYASSPSFDSCGGGCGGSCGGGSCGGGSYGGGAYGSGAYGGCGIPCDPYCYVMVEGLYITPDDMNFGPATNFSLNDFDFEWGTRITVGSVSDCVHGCEASFVGPLEWDLSQTLNSAPFATILSPLSSFTDVTNQRQTYSAEYWSLEGNKTLVGWEVAKLLVGTRYISYDEDYSYFTQTAAPASESGALISNVQNQLFGLQIGLDLLFPIGIHAHSDFRARAGAFVNFADLDFGTVNNGVASFGSDDDQELAGIFELGSGVRYQLGEILSVRAGVELWYLAGVSQAPSEIVSVAAGSSKILADDDVLFAGLSLGAELRY